MGEFARPASGAAFGGPAAAGGAGARPGHPAQLPAARRAALQPRRQAAAGNAGGDPPGLQGVPADDRLRDPRSEGGPFDLRPDGGPGGRPDPPGRIPAGDLSPAGAPLGGPFHRGDQFHRRDGWSPPAAGAPRWTPPSAPSTACSATRRPGPLPAPGHRFDPARMLAAEPRGPAPRNCVRGRIGEEIYLGELAQYAFVAGDQPLKIFELNPRLRRRRRPRRTFRGRGSRGRGGAHGVAGEARADPPGAGGDCRPAVPPATAARRAGAGDGHSGRRDARTTRRSATNSRSASRTGTGRAPAGPSPSTGACSAARAKSRATWRATTSRPSRTYWTGELRPALEPRGPGRVSRIGRLPAVGPGAAARQARAAFLHSDVSAAGSTCSSAAAPSISTSRPAAGRLVDAGARRARTPDWFRTRRDPRIFAGERFRDPAGPLVRAA